MGVVVQARAAKGFAILSVFFVLFLLPIERAASRETKLVEPSACWAKEHVDDIVQHPRSGRQGISAREQLRRRGSF